MTSPRGGNRLAPALTEVKSLGEVPSTGRGAGAAAIVAQAMQRERDRGSQSPERQPPLFAAMRMVSAITSVGLMMGVPVLAGYGLDLYFQTGPWLLMVGIALGCLGFVVGMRDLLRLAQSLSPPRLPPDDRQRKP